MEESTVVELITKAMEQSASIDKRGLFNRFQRAKAEAKEKYREIAEAQVDTCDDVSAVIDTAECAARRVFERSAAPREAPVCKTLDDDYEWCDLEDALDYQEAEREKCRKNLENFFQRRRSYYSRIVEPDRVGRSTPAAETAATLSYQIQPAPSETQQPIPVPSQSAPSKPKTLAEALAEANASTQDHKLQKKLIVVRTYEWFLKEFQQLRVAIRERPRFGGQEFLKRELSWLECWRVLDAEEKDKIERVKRLEPSPQEWALKMVARRCGAISERTLANHRKDLKAARLVQ